MRRWKQPAGRWKRPASRRLLPASRLKPRSNGFVENLNPCGSGNLNDTECTGLCILPQAAGQHRLELGALLDDKRSSQVVVEDPTGAAIDLPALRFGRRRH